LSRLRFSKAAAFLVGAAMASVGCSVEEEVPPPEEPCAKGSGDVKLCARQAGPDDATSTVVILPVGPGIGSSYLHSLADSLADVDTAAEVGIEVQTLRVITYDPRGTGSTPAPSPPSYQIADLAEDLEAVRQKVGAGPIHLVAQGWSTLVAYHYLRLHPQNVRSLTVVNGFAPRIGPNNAAEVFLAERIAHVQSQGYIPTPLPSDNGDDCNPSFVATLPAFFFYWPGTPPEILAPTPCSVSVRGQAEASIDAIPYDYLAETTAFPGPSLVIVGKNDPYGTELGDAVSASLPSAGIPVSLPSRGHYPWLDNEVGQADTKDFESHVWTLLATAP
jgi:pimeloyl-ACP methyl ester carboxylesterase